jgi:BioD-like phosphotransacetylase family protein
MPSILLAAPESLGGKTTLAVALGHRFQDSGRTVALLRLAGDTHADDDARLFGGLPFNTVRESPLVEPRGATADADITLIETPAGDVREVAESLSARVLVVAAYADPLPVDLPSFCRALGDSCGGMAITRVPSRRLNATRGAAEAAGVDLFALIPEDRRLAAPSLGAIADSLEAKSNFLNCARDNVVDRPVISSISADPSQGYFDRHSPSAVIVRGDKPDQQLGALNAGAPCLIITGGLPLLSYVEERAKEEKIPLLRTRCDTLTTVARLDALYGATPFSGPSKVERIASLADQLDLSSLA